MKQIYFCLLITVLVQFRACYPADDILSNMMSSMSKFANMTQSSMESMTSSKNTSQTFTSSKSNLLLEAAKNLDITNLTSDEEFLRLLFESVFSIIKDTKSEEFLLFSDLTVIVPTIIDKLVKQLQAAFFNVFFGGFVNAGVSAADLGLKIATALETGKLSAASQGIEAAQNIADTVASNIPSNEITDKVTKMVNASLDGAEGAIKAAKNLETESSNAISNILDRIKMANASTNPVDISSKIANTVETTKLAAASEAADSAKKIADKLAGSLPANGVTDQVKNIVSTPLEGVNAGAKVAKTLETAKLTAATQGVESAQKIAHKIADSLPSNGVTDQVKKIVSTPLEGVNAAAKVAKTLETAKLTAATQGVESAQKIAHKIADSLPSNGVTDQVKKIVSTPLEGVNAAAKVAKTLETAKQTAATQGVESAQKIADKVADSLPSNGVTDQVKKKVSTSIGGTNAATKAVKTLETVVSNAIGGLLNTFKFGK